MSTICFECQAKRNGGEYPRAFEDSGYNHHESVALALSGVRGEARKDGLLICDGCLDEIRVMEIENKESRARYARNRNSD
jgi:hypothetical protein